LIALDSKSTQKTDRKKPPRGHKIAAIPQRLLDTKLSAALLKANSAFLHSYSAVYETAQIWRDCSQTADDYRL